MFNSRSSLDYSTRDFAFMDGKEISLFLGLNVNKGMVQSPRSSSHRDLLCSLYSSFSVKRMFMTLLLNLTAFS